jgi:beta-glucosidase
MPGIVQCDAGAQHTGINSAKAGLDYGDSQYWSESALGLGLKNPSQRLFSTIWSFATLSAISNTTKKTKVSLPLKDKRSISIFGAHAAPRFVGANTALTVYNGVWPSMYRHMTTVGGSAMGSLAYITTPIQKFVERAATVGSCYASGSTIRPCQPSVECLGPAPSFRKQRLA